MTGLPNNWNIMFAETSVYRSLDINKASVLAGAPAWLEALRRDDARYLAAADAISARDDAWKYSPLASFWKKGFSPVHRAEGVISDDVRRLLIRDAYNIIVFDGQVLPQDLSLAAGMPGVSVCGGAAAAAALGSRQKYVEAVTPNDTELFLRLNRACFSDLVVIEAAPGVKFSGLIHIIHVASRPVSASFPRLFLYAGRASSVNVLQSYCAVPGLEYLSVPVADIVLEEDAAVEYAERHESSPNGFHIGSARVWQNRNSVFRSFILAGGAEIFRSNFSVMIAGEGASTEVNGLHALRGENHADSHTFLEHSVPNTRSDQLYKCVLEDESRSVFNGRVQVHREAQQTNSYQLNKNLLLSRGCRVDTKPQLEIRADDVKCTHGATIGRLNEEQLFYLQTRAIRKEAAVAMLVRGFMDDVIAKVRHPLMRGAFDQHIPKV
jgi:Fe-S cluster assembly protein SufD